MTRVERVGYRTMEFDSGSDRVYFQTEKGSELQAQREAEFVRVLLHPYGLVGWNEQVSDALFVSPGSGIGVELTWWRFNIDAQRVVAIMDLRREGGQVGSYGHHLKGFGLGAVVWKNVEVLAMAGT